MRRISFNHTIITCMLSCDFDGALFMLVILTFPRFTEDSMIGHAYIPTPVLDRRLAEKLEHPRSEESGKYAYMRHDENEKERKRQLLEKTKQFVREAPTDVSSPLQQLLKVWRECGEWCCVAVK